MITYSERKLNQAVQSVNLLLKATGYEFWRVEVVRRGRREIVVRLLSSRNTVVIMFSTMREAYAYVFGLRNMIIESARDGHDR